MADTQLKAKISADTSALNSAIDASKAKVNGLGEAGKSAMGAMGGEVARVGAAFSGIGGQAGQAGQAVAQVGGIISTAMAGGLGPISAIAAAISAIVAVTKGWAEAQAAQARKAAQVLDEQVRDYEKLAQAARSAVEAQKNTAMGNARSMFAAQYTEEGMGADGQVALAKQWKDLARSNPAAKSAYDEAMRMGLGESEANARMLGELQRQQRGNTQDEVERLEKEVARVWGEYLKETNAENEKRWREFDRALSDARKKLADLSSADWAGDWREEVEIRQKAAQKAAQKATEEYGAETASGGMPEYEKARARELREIEKRFQKLVALNRLQDKGGEDEERIARYKRLEALRDEQIAQAQKRYNLAREEAWEQTLAAQNGVKAAEEARLTLQDQAIALEKTIHQQRQQILQSELTQIKAAAEKEKQARKQLVEAEHRLAKIKGDQAAKEVYEKQKRVLNRRIAGFGFSLAENRADPRMRKLDAGVADNLSREANGERVHWTRRERARLQDYQDAQKELKRLDRREQKRQRASQQAEAERAAKQQREAWQAAKSAADEVQKKFARVGETLEGAAKRIKAALEEEVAAIRAANETQNERAKARQGRQAEAQKRQEDAAGRALKRAEDKYKGGDPNAKPPKKETLRQRRAREARERMAPGVPGAAAGGTGGGAELGVLRGIERGVDRLGDKVFVVV